jgi:hypothetical protein
MSLDPEPGGLLSKSIPEKLIPTGPAKATPGTVAVPVVVEDEEILLGCPELLFAGDLDFNPSKPK